jgi:hypothetical protein
MYIYLKEGNEALYTRTLTPDPPTRPLRVHFHGSFLLVAPSFDNLHSLCEQATTFQMQEGGAAPRDVYIQATYWIRDFESVSATSAANSQQPTRIQGFSCGSGSSSSPPTNHCTDSTAGTISTYEAVQGPLRIGLPEGVQPQKLPAGDDSYSGLHDHGPLPPLREGGQMAVLLACAQNAKSFNDDYLTEVIAAQRKCEVGGSGCSNPVKKAKVNS